jgi:hypothetical protein
MKLLNSEIFQVALYIFVTAALTVADSTQVALHMIDIAMLTFLRSGSKSCYFCHMY